MGLYIQIDWTDTEGTAYKIEIDKPDWVGNVFQVRGSAVLEYPKVKTMDVLRGSVLKMQLEASKEFLGDTWINGLIGEVGDKKLKTTLYKSGSVFWNGFIKPDGIVESFVADYWVVNVQAVDGLGYLENIAFLKSDGDKYKGSVSELDLLTRCLQLTGLTMNYRIYDFNLYFSSDGNEPQFASAYKALRSTYVNTDRFIKDTKENEVFDVKEVLNSILKKYGAFITQQDNEWHIVRLIDFYKDDTIDTRLYDSDGVFVSDTTIDMRNDLGSQIDSYYPHHANTNQQKTYKSALGAYKVYYQYGVISSILENTEVLFDDNAGTIDGWLLDAGATDITYVENNDGKYVARLPYKSNSYVDFLTYDVSTYPQNFEQDDTLQLSVEVGFYVNQVAVTNNPGDDPGILKRRHYIRVSLIGTNGETFYLNDTGEWTLSDAKIKIFSYYNNDGSAVIEVEETVNSAVWSGTTNGLPTDGNIVFELYYPKSNADTDNGSYLEWKNIKVNGADLGIKGESWTARRLETNPSSVVDLEDKLKVGDSDNDAYIGSIEDVDGFNTSYWCKVDELNAIDLSKQFNLLNWLVRDRMTISGGNSTIFNGGIYGYLPYLGILSINNVTGIFMTVAWSHNLLNNTINATHERIFTDDIYSNVSVSFAYESDNVVRPTIE